MIYKIGTKRPLVGLIQKVVGADIDCWFGKGTEEKVKEFQRSFGLDNDGKVGKQTLSVILSKTNSEIEFVKYKIAEMVSVFEGGWRQDIFGYTSVVDDGAGMNYGFMQHNKYGSLQIMQKDYGCPKGDQEEIKWWYGSSEGIKAQMQYFESRILMPAFNKIIEFKKKDMKFDNSQRFLAVLCDATVQGGAIYPTKNVKSWEYWELSQEELEKCKDIYKEDKKIKEKFEDCLRIACDASKMYAEVHPRSGSTKWLQDQLSRRRTVVRGSGVVHGDKINIEEMFGL